MILQKELDNFFANSAPPNRLDILYGQKITPYYDEDYDSKEIYKYHLDNFKESLKYFKKRKINKRIINLFKKYYEI